jgi:hypothetical protein
VVDTDISGIVPMRLVGDVLNSALLCVLCVVLGSSSAVKSKTKPETAEDAEVLAEERRVD